MEESQVKAIVDDWHLERKGRPDRSTIKERPWCEGAWVRLSVGDVDRSALTLITAPAPDQAVCVLALGSVEENTAFHDGWLEAPTELLRKAPAPITIELDGRRWTFSPSRGRWLLGYALVGELVALLGHDGERILILLGDGERFELRAAARLGEVPPVIMLDAPAMVRSEPEPEPEAKQAPRSRRGAERSPSSTIQETALAHHRRILDDRPAQPSEEGLVGVDLIVSIALVEVARRAKLRACRLGKKDKACIARGAPNAPAVLYVLRRLKHNALCTGRALFHLCRELDPDRISMSEHDFVCVLGLLVATKTCLVTRERGKLWGIWVEGIDQVDHPLHLQLCKETRTGAGRQVIRRGDVIEVAAVEAAPGERAIEGTSEDGDHRWGGSPSQRHGRDRGPARGRGSTRRRTGAGAGKPKRITAGMMLAAFEAIAYDVPEGECDPELVLAAQRWLRGDNQHEVEDRRRLEEALSPAHIDETFALTGFSDPAGRPPSPALAEDESSVPQDPLVDDETRGQEVESTTSAAVEHPAIDVPDVGAAEAINDAVYKEGPREASATSTSNSERGQEGDVPPDPHTAPTTNAASSGIGVAASVPASTNQEQLARRLRAEAWLRARGPGLPDLTPSAARVQGARASPPTSTAIEETDSPPRRSG